MIFNNKDIMYVFFKGKDKGDNSLLINETGNYFMFYYHNLLIAFIIFIFSKTYRLVLFSFWTYIGLSLGILSNNQQYDSFLSSHFLF